MIMRDTVEKFSVLTVALHWVIAIGIIGLLAFGLYLEEMPRSPEKGMLIGLHKSFGILVFVLAVIRIIWRILNKFPKPLRQLPNWQAALAKLTHWMLIIGTVLMPVSGVMMSIGGGHPIGFFGFELVAGVGHKDEVLSEIGSILHGVGGKVFIALIVLHLIGVFKHLLLDKDGTVQRMLGRYQPKM